MVMGCTCDYFRPAAQQDYRTYQHTPGVKQDLQHCQNFACSAPQHDCKAPCMGSTAAELQGATIPMLMHALDIRNHFLNLSHLQLSFVPT